MDKLFFTCIIITGFAKVLTRTREIVRIFIADDPAAPLTRSEAAVKASAAKVEGVGAAIVIGVGVEALTALIAYGCQLVRADLAEHVFAAAQHRENWVLSAAMGTGVVYILFIFFGLSFFVS